MKTKYFLSFSVFNTTPSMLSIINYATKNKDMFTYETSNGTITTTKQEIENENVKIVTINEIDIQKSLYHWFKNNPSQHGKQIVLDETIESGEIYSGRCWCYSLMLNCTKDEIKFKIITE
jgi:esterase/lipase superfamily enzyme